MAAPKSHPFVKAALPALQKGMSGAPSADAELKIFAGWAGDSGQRSDGGTWLQFFLDPQLYHWMLIEGRRIRYTVRVKETESATGGCDYIWVDADAPVGRGSGTQPAEAPFLTGAFTRAADFRAPPIDGPSGGRTGPFCVGKSPLCGYCYRPPKTR